MIKTTAKFLLFFIVSILHFTSLSLLAEEKIEEPASVKKYRLSTCSLFKNEAKYLKEWLEFHRLVGVDHFYLYNNGSFDNYMDVLTPYIKNGIVTLVYWPGFIPEESSETTYLWSLSTQVTAYENAVRLLAVRDTQWLVFLDVGEFLLPGPDINLVDLLEAYDQYPGVLLSSEFYDVCPMHALSRRGLTIEALELTRAPEQNMQKAVEKMIFKPEECTHFLWPPFQYAFRDENRAIKISKKAMRINHYTNRKRMPSWAFAKAKEKMHVDNRMISDEEKTYWLEVGYEIEDQERSIHRFLPELLKKIGYDPLGN
jgi:hypothetical protein